MPGAALTAVPRDGHVRGRLHIKLGPIAADFAGEADIERDPTNHRGVIRGHGRDLRTSSTVVGEVSYVLVEEGSGAATRVDVEVGYALRGALAQFSRSGIVNDLAERLTADFAKNVEARLRRRRFLERGGGSAGRARRRLLDSFSHPGPDQAVFRPAPGSMSRLPLQAFLRRQPLFSRRQVEGFSSGAPQSGLRRFVILSSVSMEL